MSNLVRPEAEGVEELCVHSILRITAPRIFFFSPLPLSLTFQAPSADREQAMRDYKLSIEYKQLKQFCPGGVYLIPSPNNIRFFHGVIFVRRGPFTNGIFKFTLEVDAKYNDRNLHPKVTFTSYVYNPHVHPETGEVDIRIAYPEWDSGKHYLVTVLTYIKRIFYYKDYDDEEKSSKFPNQDALKSFKNNPENYKRRVQECVKESQRGIYMNDPGCTIRFKEEDKVYEIFRDLMKQQFLGYSADLNTSASSEEISRSVSVTCEETLKTIKQAQSQVN